MSAFTNNDRKCASHKKSRNDFSKEFVFRDWKKLFPILYVTHISRNNQLVTVSFLQLCVVVKPPAPTFLTTTLDPIPTIKRGEAGCEQASRSLDFLANLPNIILTLIYSNRLNMNKVIRISYTNLLNLDSLLNLTMKSRSFILNRIPK